MNAASVTDHYADLLAPVYLWMAGGLDAALEQGAADLAPFMEGGGVAVDLGAGFGMHAIPLARAGWEVVALDTSEHLLAQLRALGAGLPIHPVLADLSGFRQHLGDAPLRLAVCMGDTLTHLADREQVATLLRDVAAALAPGGRFVATFRDHLPPRDGVARFVPVRADADRILTCFIEPAGDRVMVHDLLHERRDGVWSLRVSAYPKLRLATGFVRDVLAQAGLAVTVEPGPRGMVRVQARA